MSDIHTFIAQYLKQNDPERYFSTLVFTSPLREEIQALNAFSADVAQIRERVSEPMPGEIRLQYWTDLLSGNDHGQTNQNPLATGLMQTIDKYDLPTGPLRRLIAARRFDLYDDAMTNLSAFEGYAGETNSILYQLATLIINGGNDAGAADAAGHIGVAHALIGHLRSLSITAARGQIFLPWSIFEANKASETDFLSGRATPEIIAACKEVRHLAREHLNLANIAINELSAQVRPAFAPIAVLTSQLERLEQFCDLPFTTPPDLANWQKIAKLLWWSIRN